MYVAGVIDSCGSVRANRVRVLVQPSTRGRVSCSLPILTKISKVLDTYTIPYQLQPPYLTINQEEGLVLLYGHVPLMCSVKRATLKKIVSRICLGGLEPYPLGEIDKMGWLQGVMDMRGSYITTGKNKWYSITTTNTDVVGYLSQVLTGLDIDYNLYTVEREGRRTLYNTRIYKGRDIERLIEIQATA